MVDLSFVFAAFVILLLVWALDRFVLRRGAIALHNCEIFDAQEGYWRFALQYTLKQYIFWGEIRYQLRDKSNPSTVITGKARSLDHAMSGANHEFLHIKQALTATSNTTECWELIVVASTVVGHWNPLYKFFPLTKKMTFEVCLNEK